MYSSRGVYLSVGYLWHTRNRKNMLSIITGGALFYDPHYRSFFPCWSRHQPICYQRLPISSLCGQAQPQPSQSVSRGHFFLKALSALVTCKTFHSKSLEGQTRSQRGNKGRDSSRSRGTSATPGMFGRLPIGCLSAELPGGPNSQGRASTSVGGVFEAQPPGRVINLDANPYKRLIKFHWILLFRIRKPPPRNTCQAAPTLLGPASTPASNLRTQCDTPKHEEEGALAWRQLDLLTTPGRGLSMVTNGHMVFETCEFFRDMRVLSGLSRCDVSPHPAHEVRVTWSKWQGPSAKMTILYFLHLYQKQIS